MANTVGTPFSISGTTITGSTPAITWTTGTDSAYGTSVAKTKCDAMNTLLSKCIGLSKMVNNDKNEEQLMTLNLISLKLKKAITLLNDAIEDLEKEASIDVK